MIVDPLLPSAVHLTGPAATDVLRPVVRASGGELLSARLGQVQYRPETDLIVRYRCRIRRAGVDRTEVVFAGTTTRGVPTGSVPVEARSPDGSALSVGVWRWPFDPTLAALTTMTTQHLAAAELGHLVGSTPELTVVAHRPTERAVIRVRGRDRCLYVKVVPADTTDRIVALHDALGDAGIPVPRVVAAGHGWFAMEELTGTTLRDRVKGDDALPPVDRLGGLLDSMRSVSLPSARPVRSRVVDAPHHAAMVSAVLPAEAARLAELVDRIGPDVAPERLVTVHGDLHEAQLVVDDRSVVGVLDVDDVGLGDPADDAATLIGHLRFRAVVSHRTRVDEYADDLRAMLAATLDPDHLDRRIAAALVGLSTGPFRIQQPDWEATTARVLDAASFHLDAASAAAR